MADGQDVRDLVPKDDDRIRLIHIADSLTIGEKRNFGCERATGEFICHWDDDDWSGPGRINDQLTRLRNGMGVHSATGYHSMRFTDGTVWWEYTGTRNFSLGTSLFYRKDYWELNHFSPIHIGEDNAFVENSWRNGKLSTANAGDLMYATIHAGNTSPRTMGSSWTRL